MDECLHLKPLIFHFASMSADAIKPGTVLLNIYEVMNILNELFVPDLNPVLQATFSKAGAELGTAQPQLVLFFDTICNT